MLPSSLLVIAAVVSAASPSPSPGKFDFEQGEALSAYPGLQPGQPATVVPRDSSQGHCLQVSASKPSSSASLTWNGPHAVQKNQLLSFDYKAQVQPGFEGAYVAVGFFVDGQQAFWTSQPFSTDWRHAEILVGRLRDHRRVEMKLGLTFSKLQIYAKVKEKTAEHNGTRARVTLWIDNLRWEPGVATQTALDAQAVESYSNPPLFNWEPIPGAAAQRLEYAATADFRSAVTHSMPAGVNFFTPAQPLSGDTWYWRVWSEGPLYDAYSSVHCVKIVPPAHKFITPPIPIERLARTPHPRLLPLAQLDQPEPTQKRKADWVKQARKIYQRGVPEHPGPHVPGDARWPTWIEWYGKVAGSITGGTGRRLQSLGQYAMLSGDPQVAEWAKELLLAACRWDPEGGSAMKLGDIGAHHLLRGLSWCYDAAWPSLSPDQRQQVRRVLVQRAEQFWHSLNPSRSLRSEANNHAWLRALALAECGMVLAGEHAEAGQWAEFVRQLYVGRFLPCLGNEGENNEGIGYWNYGLGFVIDYADLVRALTGIDLYAHPWLRRTARFPMYCAPPGGWAVSFADTGMPNHGVRGPAETATVRKLALRTRDPYALWYSGATEAVDGLAPKAPADLPASIFWPHIGVGIFHTSLVDASQGVTVAMHSGRFWSGHQHPDQNHFVIHSYGDRLAIDGGYYDWYGSPHFKGYSMTTLAHNTLLVDGEGQAACTVEADGQTTAWFDSPKYGCMVGDASAPAIYGGRLKRFDRRLLFIKPGFVVIHDLVEAQERPRRLDWLLHAIVPVELARGERSLKIEGKQTALWGRFLAPRDIDLEVTSGFPVEPVNRYSRDPVPKEQYVPEWRVVARPPSPVAQTEFFFVAQIARREPAERPAKFETLPSHAAQAARAVCGNKQYLIVSRKAGAAGITVAEKLETDAMVAAVETDEQGTVTSGMALAATRLKWAGKTLFESPTPRDWSKP